MLIGAQGEERITAEEVAGRLGTINYEVTCGLLARVPRPITTTACRHDACRSQVPKGSSDAMSEARSLARDALRDRRAWLVGGAVRDDILGRPTSDLDLAVEGDVRSAASALARAARGPLFELSDAFGSWRVLAADRSWQADLSPLRGGSLEADLALRDFTVNAIAEPLGGGERIDPFGGAGDLAAGCLRAVGPRSFADDPLRVVRLVRLAAEHGLAPEPATRELARTSAPEAAAVAQERVFAELKRILAGDGVLGSLRLMEDIGLTEAILPELHALRGVEQNRYHHADVYAHTLEVLEQAVALQADPAAVLGVGAATGRPSRRCSPSRSPRRSTGASGCASARCCTTSPSPPRWAIATTARRPSSAMTAPAPIWRATCSPACAPASG